MTEALSWASKTLILWQKRLFNKALTDNQGK